MIIGIKLITPIKLLHGKYPQGNIKQLKMEILRQFRSLAWCKADWCFPSTSKETNELLRGCLNIPDVDLAVEIYEIIEKSQHFPIKFPVETVRMHTLRDKRPIEDLKRNIASTYPIIHERVLLLITHFLIYKRNAAKWIARRIARPPQYKFLYEMGHLLREFGSSIEKALYKDMTIIEFIDRLLLKRAIAFLGKNDHYKLISGEEDHEGWEHVGTIHQKPPLTLDKVLSYDEMKISALIYVSGRTEFINNGARANAGVYEESGVEKDGVIIGLIGPRLKRRNRMEFEDMVICDMQNLYENGYGDEVTPITCLNVLKTAYVRNNQTFKHMWRQIWSEFYQVHSYTYNELTSSTTISPENSDDKTKYTSRYVKLSNIDGVFDNEVYYKRLSVSLECTLIEGCKRGEVEGKMVVINVVGIGLGVWKISAHQTDVFVLTLLERLRYLLKRDLLSRVSDVMLNYIRPSESIEELFIKRSSDGDSPVEKKIFFESKRHPNGGIAVELSNLEPSSQLSGDRAGKLLVTTYPWDGNAHPGNEFWLGSLTGSGDPAAACSTQVAELHNAYINRLVCGNNVRVVTSTGLKTIKEYCHSVLDT